MRSHLLAEAPARRWMLVFDRGDDVLETLTHFADVEQLDGARLAAIGAFSEATLAFWDPREKEYRSNPLHEQVEAVSVLGNVALGPDGGRKVHAHALVALPDGTTRGGHLLHARVNPTLELVLDEGGPLRRRTDSDSGLALLE